MLEDRREKLAQGGRVSGNREGESESVRFLVNTCMARRSGLFGAKRGETDEEQREGAGERRPEPNSWLKHHSLLQVAGLASLEEGRRRRSRVKSPPRLLLIPPWENLWLDISSASRTVQRRSADVRISRFSNAGTRRDDAEDRRMELGLRQQEL